MCINYYKKYDLLSVRVSATLLLYYKCSKGPDIVFFLTTSINCVSHNYSF